MHLKILVGLVVFGVGLASCSAKDTQTISPEAREAFIQTSRAASDRLGQELKAKLIAALEADGPVKAVEVCAEVAPTIAYQISQDTGMKVGRTSLKVRNGGNMPDEFETFWLKAFTTDMASGQPASELEGWAVASENGEPVFRWMKPIPMGGVCQTCHGIDVADDVKAAILSHYPEDEAMGFKPGELRGAFTVSIPLKQD